MCLFVDETWIHHIITDTNDQPIQSVSSSEHARKKNKVGLSSKKIILTVFLGWTLCHSYYINISGIFLNVSDLWRLIKLNLYAAIFLEVLKGSSNSAVPLPGSQIMPLKIHNHVLSVRNNRERRPLRILNMQVYILHLSHIKNIRCQLTFRTQDQNCHVTVEGMEYLTKYGN